MSQNALRSTAIALLAIGTGATALGNGFVWDDSEMLTERVVRELAGIIDIWLAPATIESEGHYWPITWTSFWLDYRLHGEWAGGWHATNIILHAGVSVMVARTMTTLGARGAWIAGALFAVHPLHAEVIGWTMARKDALAALLALASAQRWLADDEAGRASPWPSVLLAGALLAKSSAVAAVPAIAIALWWRAGAIERAQLARLAPLALVAGAVVGADAVRYAGIDTYRMGHDLATRLGAAGWALGSQVMTFAWPMDLTPMRGPYPGAGANAVGWAMLGGVAAVLVALVLLAHRIGRAPAAALGCFVVALVPTLGIIEFSFLRFSATADRYAYIASIGPIALAGAGAAIALERAGGRWGGKGAGPVMATLCAGVAALGVLSARHTQVYRDNITFFTQVHAQIPGNAAMTFNLAKALADAGDLEQSVQVARAGAQRHRDDARLAHREGDGLRKLARHAEAETAYRRAARLRPGRAMTYVGLGYTLSAQGKHTQAIAAFTAAAARAPALRSALAGDIAKAQLMLGQVHAAIVTYRNGLEMNPGDPRLHTNLASVLIAVGEPDEARAHVERALALAPNLTLARELQKKLEQQQ